MALPLGEAFHARRLTMQSSQVGSVAASQRARWDTRRRMQLALSLLADPALDVLITGESEFEELPGVMAELAERPGRYALPPNLRVCNEHECATSVWLERVLSDPPECLQCTA